MTDTPTKPPSGLRPVKLDEWIAIFVSLGTFGSIFFWATTRENNGFNLLSKTMVSTPLSETVGNPRIEEQVAFCTRCPAEGRRRDQICSGQVCRGRQLVGVHVFVAQKRQ